MEQITLDLGQVKEEIKEELKKAANSFIFIGYRLRQILDSGAYRQDGYDDIYDFAKKEFGMGQSAVSRFMAINEKYSVGGYGPTLLPEYEAYGSSKLSEMLTLSGEDTKMISSDMPVSQIREVKSFVRQDGSTDGQQSFTAGTDRKALYADLFKDIPEKLKYIWENVTEGKELCEILNPSGSRVFKYRTTMLVMHGPQQGVNIREFGKTPETFSWEDILLILKTLFSEEDINKMISDNATSHISQDREGTLTEPESKKEGQQEEKEEEISKNRHEKEEKGQQDAGEALEESKQEAAEAPEPEEKEAAVEKIAPEDTEIVQEEKKGTNWERRKQEEAIQSHKRSVVSNMDDMQRALEREDWERVQNLAESIRWAAREIRDLKGDFEG